MYKVFEDLGAGGGSVRVVGLVAYCNYLKKIIHTHTYVIEYKVLLCGTFFEILFI